MQINNQYGRSMIEMLGVLSVIGILTTGGFNLVMKSRMHQAVNETVDNMTALAQKTRHIIRDYQLDIEDGATSDDLNVYVNSANAVPEGLEWDDSSSKWTDRNDVSYDVRYVGDNPIFWVEVSGLSEEMCLSMSNGSYGSANSSGFLGVAYGTDTDLISAPVAIATAVSSCEPAQNETTVTMKFGFR